MGNGHGIIRQSAAAWLPPRRRDHRLAKRGLPPLLFLTDERRHPGSAAIIQALPPGCGVVLRDYGRPDRAQWAKALIRLCRRQRRLVLVAGRVQDALGWGADGVHVPRWGQTPAQRPRRRWLVTAAAHDPAEAVAARRAGADAVMLSPLFATKSHPDGAPLGVLRFRLLARWAGLPVIALGGLDGGTARRVRGVPLAAMAAIGGLARRRVRN